MDRENPILIVGDIITDIDYKIVNKKPSPEDDSSWCFINPEIIRTTPGGAGHVANNVNNTGNITLLAGISSRVDDFHSDIVLIGMDNSQPTCTKNRYFENYDLLFRIDEDSPEQEYLDYSSTLSNRLDVYTGFVGTVIISDYGKGTINTEVLDTLFADISKVNLCIVDPKEKMFDHYASPNVVLKPNAREALALSGANTPGSAAKRLRDNYGCRVVVTCGADGFWIADEDGIHYHDAIPLVPVSVVGAGDTAAAVLAAALHRNITLLDAVDICAKCCASVIAQPGTTPISKEFWQELMQTYEVN